MIQTSILLSGSHADAGWAREPAGAPENHGATVSIDPSGAPARASLPEDLDSALPPVPICTRNDLLRQALERTPDERGSLPVLADHAA